jgi:hypothetical protein
MKSGLVSAVIGVALAGVAVTVADAAPKSNVALKSNRVSIEYVLPKNSAHQQIFEYVKEKRVLEKMQEFLSPFRLPRTLKISARGCDGEADAFYGNGVITICYEYLDELWKTVPAETTSLGLAPIDTALGPLYDTALHEFAHALFEMLKIPVLGREEDAADQVAAYIYLQLGQTEARRLISGAVYAFKLDAERGPATPPLQSFADEHSTPAQRAYNLLCIAYGADPKLFDDIRTKGYLPEKRLDGCEEEYERVQDAFEKLITPHIDSAVAKKVLNKSWLPAPTTRVKHRSSLPAAIPSPPR